MSTAAAVAIIVAGAALHLLSVAAIARLSERRVLRAIHAAEGKIMPALDDLTTALTAASNGLATLTTDTSALVAELHSLQGTTTPDLSKAIAAATAISTGIASIDANVKAALPPPTTTTTTPPPATTTAP